MKRYQESQYEKVKFPLNLNNTDPLDSFLDAIQGVFKHEYVLQKEDYYLST